MTEDMPLPGGGKEPAEEKEEINTAERMETMYKIAVDWLGISEDDVRRTASNALNGTPALKDEEIKELYDKICGRLIQVESHEHQINKLFLEIQGMIEDSKKEQVKTIEEKDSFLDTVKLNKASIIAQWGRAGYVGMSLLGGAIGWFITYMAGLS